jgi:hypothetical protein
MPNADRHAVWDTREVPTLTTLYHWTSNSSLWWEFLQTELLCYIEHVHIAAGGWICLHLGGVPLFFCQKCYGVHEWILLRKVDGKRFTSGMTSTVAQLRAPRFLPVGLHVVWVVPQQLVHFAVERAAVTWIRLEHTLHEWCLAACMQSQSAHVESLIGL